ncbi:MAG: TatD family hydrolase [Rikenellaceae bacterium]
MQIPYINIHTHTTSGAEVIDIFNYSPLKSVSQFISPHSIGLHPKDAALASTETLDTLLQSKPLAIGEIGLDYSIEIDKALQIEAFEKQVDIASKNHLPIIIHTVRAIEPTLYILSRATTPIIIHGFVGHAQTVKRFLDQGHYISFGHRTMLSPKSLEALKFVPKDRLFIETDAHDISIKQLYAIFAQTLEMDIEVLKQQTYNNFNTIFNL